MGMEAQQTLVEPEAMPVQPSEPPPDANPSAKPVFGQKRRMGKPVKSAGAAGDPKLKPIDRSQLLMQTVDLEHLLEPNHPARAIWDLVGRLDLTPFLGAIRSQQGEKG